MGRVLSPCLLPAETPNTGELWRKNEEDWESTEEIPAIISLPLLLRFLFLWLPWAEIIFGVFLQQKSIKLSQN